MTRTHKIVVVFLALLMIVIPQIVNAQNKVGTTAAPWLTIGIGTRPQAMGSAFVAVANDANALYWNPAGLAKLPRNQVLLVHSTWLAEMNMEYVGAAFPAGPMGTFGISTTVLNAGQMEVTTVDQQEGTGLFFDSYSMAAGLHYGYAFYDKFSLGGTVKYIREQIWNEFADGIAFDIGTLFIMPIHDTRLGMNISNFGSKLQMNGRDLEALYDPDQTKAGNNDKIPVQYVTEQWKLPLTLRIGISGELIRTGWHRLTYALDWVVPNDNTEFINAGGEYSLLERYFIRAGYRGLRPYENGAKNNLIIVDNGGGWTVGAGTNLKLYNMMELRVDYTYSSYERLGGVHKYSLMLSF